MKRTNALRNLSLSLLLAAGVFAAPAYAQVSFNISIAPPAPQYEVVPIIEPGYVWAPGYWGWTGERHVWVRGRSIRQREGFVWAPDRWDQHDRNFVRTAGHWEQDRGFKPAKVKNDKNHNGRDNDERGDGRHDNGKHNGDKHER